MDLQKRVVEAATASFQQFGYKGTTMDQVARIANVGKGTIYTFFASKEELFQSILQSFTEELKQVAEAAMLPEATFFTNLERVLRNILQFRKQHELFAKLAQEARQFGTATVVEGLEQVERAIVGYIRDHLDRGVANGNVKPCDTELVAFILFKTYRAMVTDWEWLHPPLSDEELMAMFHLVFAEGLNQSP